MEKATIYGAFVGIPAAFLLCVSLHCAPAGIAVACSWVADWALMLHFAGIAGKCGNELRKDAEEYQQITQVLQKRSEMADLAHSVSDKDDNYAVEVGDDFVQIDGVRLKVHKHVLSPFFKERK